MKKLIFLLLVIVSTVLHAQVNKRTGMLIDTLTTTELNNLNDKFKISGSLFYDDTLKSFVTYKNGGWVSLGGSGGSTYTAGEVSITDLGSNFTSTDVEGALAELASADGDYLPLSAGVSNPITGQLVVESPNGVTVKSSDPTTKGNFTMSSTGFYNTKSTSNLGYGQLRIDVIGELSYDGPITFSNYGDGGDAIEMLVINDSGDLSTQSIPSGSGSSNAEDITYDNTTSGLTATDVQDAIDELSDASNINVTDTSGFFSSDNVEDILGEIGQEIEDLAPDPNLIVSDNTEVTGSDAITNIISATQAEIDADPPSSSTLAICSDCAPMNVQTSSAIEVDGYVGIDDRSTDTATFTFSNLRAGAVVEIEADRATDATYSGITFVEHPNSDGFIANTEQLIWIKILPSGRALRAYSSLE